MNKKMNGNEIEILLVEDNVHDAELTIRSLKKVNLANKLIHVRDGAEALDFIFAKGDFAGRNILNRPKVVLLDIKMPKVDGIEVLRQIKSNETTKTIPVVMMTSSKEEQDMISSYNLGVNSYVVKPVDFEGFVKAVCELGLYWLITNQQIQ
ncbi:response regulator [Mucilaginibacter xinganensis]|uniref:Two-component system response regulator n=1 Tax=Mucilaginibacter xinganensis TaxID=1234841 RepID=A0A223NXI6_9SPHI|nr:response regulator [Mucilaginibacter xinganensis]ASU34575.1 two-component system response regulator [Mucilaginibacter xinganensis]